MPCLLIFERNNLPFKIEPALNTTYLELEDMVERAGTDNEMLDSHLSRFQYVLFDDNNDDYVDAVYLTALLLNFNHMLNAPANQEFVTILFESFTHFSDAS